jgi:hypothetical protein
MGTLHDDESIFMIVLHWILPRMRKVRTKVAVKTKTHILYSITFFQNCVIYEIIWENTIERDRPKMTKYSACTLYAG